jgi:hypothetical protein
MAVTPLYLLLHVLPELLYLLRSAPKWKVLRAVLYRAQALVRPGALQKTADRLYLAVGRCVRAQECAYGIRSTMGSTHDQSLPVLGGR